MMFPHHQSQYFSPGVTSTAQPGMAPNPNYGRQQQQPNHQQQAPLYPQYPSQPQTSQTVYPHLPQVSNVQTQHQQPPPLQSAVHYPTLPPSSSAVNYNGHQPPPGVGQQSHYIAHPSVGPSVHTTQLTQPQGVPGGALSPSAQYARPPLQVNQGGSTIDATPNYHGQSQSQQVYNGYHPQQNQNYYSSQQHQIMNNDVGSLSKAMGGLSVTQQGFNKLWGNESIDLLKQRNIMPSTGVSPPEIRFQHEYMNSVNCSPDIFRCTLTKIPESKSLLQKSRLPLGILIHPFKDLSNLPVIQCNSIVRCRACRTYINPFVYFVDQRRWKCNLCSRLNDLPDEFQYDPVTRTSGDPSRRPEVRSATIEFLAPADYMVRPPQAAVYLYVLDVSANAVDTGYLKTICDILLEELDKIPGDSRTQIGFITFDSAVHFYNLAEGLSQPHQYVVCDINDIFIPCPTDLLVNLNESKDIIRHLLTHLPTKFLNTSDNQSALGAALQAAQKLLAPIGGRITMFQSCLSTIGPGSMTNREVLVKNPKDLTPVLNPSTDFYKKIALECSQQYIAVDLFFINNQYVDIATIGCAAKFSGGNIYQFPGFHATENPTQNFLLEQAFQRYVVRKVGFEAVMRVRCSRGMSIHTFHGNFFVRSTDLLSLPNCNPDSGFGMQVSIDETLTDLQTVCFQAALLYTSSKGERRIRVHTLCLPVAGNVNDIIASADQQCIVGLVAKMAVDRCQTSSLIDAREACTNAVVDALSAYATTQNAISSISLFVPPNLAMLPTYMHALLRSTGFRTDTKIRLDDRVQFMNQMKTLPLTYLIQNIYPDLYPIHDVDRTPLIGECDDPANETPDFPLLQLCSDRIDSFGAYLMDTPELILVYICRSISVHFCQNVLGVSTYSGLNELNEFPELETTASIRIRNFVENLQSLKPFAVPIRIFRDDSRERMNFVNRMMEDRGEGNVSLYEFLQQLKPMVNR